jgi:hypothetical protein
VKLSGGQKQARMAKGIHGLPKVSPGPALSNPSTPCGRATPKTALWPFLGWSACRAGSLRPSSTPLDTPRRTDLVRSSTSPSHTRSSWTPRSCCWTRPTRPRTRERRLGAGEFHDQADNVRKQYSLKVQKMLQRWPTLGWPIGWLGMATHRAYHYDPLTAF